ncbi:cupin domain-containing protein [Pseudonocardia sp. N23]|uniref:cupin domain-containing protein n=1 Tax=Pseudonocardia sp. N23 TaxID=1987376 RepID=UPI000C029271|nr:cupin domain-containing protein [Pseudonocardia sp. N23]GAY07685.1 transcriptional regulator, Cro/CI family [Pseudonocardia sp. N23]
MEPEARTRLRTARTDAQLSVRELSRRVGISPSMLSQIENGHSEPSVATLYSLVSELEISLDQLLAGPGAERGPRAPVTPSPLVTPDRRAVLVMESGVTWERLTHDSDPMVAALLVTYPPDSSSSVNGGLMRHQGHEYAFLLSGRLTVRLGFDTLHLEPGSSISFDSTVPHLYLNEGDEPARGLWHVVTSAPAAADPAAEWRPVGAPLQQSS